MNTLTYGAVQQDIQIDTDASAFMSMAGITATTQKYAINYLVINLKANKLWTNMKAIYPFIGGTEYTHKWNLKDPRDLDAAFRLTFVNGVNGVTGWTHSASGAKPENELILRPPVYVEQAHAETHIIPSVDFNDSSYVACGYYSRTNSAIYADYLIGSQLLTPITRLLGLVGKRDSGAGADGRGFFISSYTTVTYDTARQDDPNRRGDGFYGGSQIGTHIYYFRNETTLASDTARSYPTGDNSTNQIYLGCMNNNGSTQNPTYKECAFAFFSTGLSVTQWNTLNTIVQKYQENLNRQIDTDADAFTAAAGITGATLKYAVNYLVVNLKKYNLWTKMKAIYPVIGGTATTHKYNLKDPRDLDAAFRLTFYGGLTHSSSGILPNGTTGYMTTYLIPSSILTLNNVHMSFYSKTDVSEGTYEMGVISESSTNRLALITRYNNDTMYSRIYDLTDGGISATNTNSTGLFICSRTSSSYHAIFKNNTKLNSNTTSGGSQPTSDVWICQVNNNGTPANNYCSKLCAFASIGDGLSDTDSLNLYNIVQEYQTILGRQV